MQVARLQVNEALANLKTKREGLTTAEAARRLNEFGYNRVVKPTKRRWFLRFIKSYTHFLAIVLWLAAILALVADHLDPLQGMDTLGFAIVGVIIINGAFAFFQEYRAEKSLTMLSNLLPKKVRVTRDGIVISDDAEKLVPGDIIVLSGGDAVPADARIVEAFSARANHATITGESVPLPRNADVFAGDELMQSPNLLFAGTALLSGEVKAVVYATAMNTEFGKIAEFAHVAKPRPSPLQIEIAHVSRIITIIATSIGAVFFVLGHSLGLSFWANMIFAIGILVANVPEGLLPTVTLALAMGGRRMAKHNVLIRHLPSVETLGCVNVICTDKTGTLTQNRMEVKQAYFDTTLYDNGGIKDIAQHCSAFVQVTAYCHNLSLNWVVNDDNGDPIDVALKQLAMPYVSSLPLLELVDQIPFDSERRRLTMLYRDNDRYTLLCKGALESLLPHCSRILEGEHVVTINPTKRQQLLAAETAMAENGLRVIALAYRDFETAVASSQWESELIVVGLIGLRDPPRPEVASAITECRRAGIKVHMVTGDHPNTALAIAKEIGLVPPTHGVTFSGKQLNKMSDSELQLALDAEAVIFARTNAQQKHRIVTLLQRKGNVVAATGDGVNDAPALRQADIGIAMGATGSDITREAAHMVLVDDNFSNIVRAIEEGRAVYANIRKFLTYILTSNIPEVVPYLAFVLFKIPLPLTIIQILVVDLGTDMLPALALGSEPPEKDIMRQAPRPRHERLLNARLLTRAYLFLGMFEALAAMSAFFYVLFAAGWQYGQVLDAHDPVYLQATTACLSAIIVMQMVNVFLCRSRKNSIFTMSLVNNKFLYIGLAMEFFALWFINYTEFGNRVFGTAPLTGDVFLFILPFALLLLCAEELRKLIVRRVLAPSDFTREQPR